MTRDAATFPVKFMHNVRNVNVWLNGFSVANRDSPTGVPHFVSFTGRLEYSSPTHKPMWKLTWVRWKLLIKKEGIFFRRNEVHREEHDMESDVALPARITLTECEGYNELYFSWRSQGEETHSHMQVV
jgi:hypothetical protein